MLSSSNLKIMATRLDNSRTETASNISKSDNSPCKYVKFPKPSHSDSISSSRISKDHQKKMNSSTPTRFADDVIGEVDDLWQKIREKARIDTEQEPILSNYYFASILSHSSLESALAYQLATKLSTSNLPSNVLTDIFLGVFTENPEIKRAIRADLKAVKERDPACISFVHCFLNFKGFLACQAHRVAHNLWKQGRTVLAMLIQNRVSEIFAVDIHPGAKLGQGILLDHATGVVIGETAMIGNNVSILHNVTLGGTGKESGDRHPKIGDGVLVGAGTQILGSVRVGEWAKIGAGSVVLKEVPPRTTAVGNPARLIGGKENPIKLDKIPSFTMDHTSFMSWSDYVI